MKSDIEIAQEAQLYPITGTTCAIPPLYGNYKAKIPFEVMKRNETKKDFSAGDLGEFPELTAKMKETSVRLCRD